MEKQRLLYQQARLHNRGAAEMVLQMISACKGALPQAPLLSTRSPSPLPPAHHFLGTPWHTLPPCAPVPHTPALARPTRLAISRSSFLLARDATPFSHLPWGGRFLVGGGHGSQTERAIFCHLSRRDGRHGVLHPEAGHLHPKWRQC